MRSTVTSIHTAPSHRRSPFSCKVSVFAPEQFRVVPRSYERGELLILWGSKDEVAPMSVRRRLAMPVAGLFSHVCFVRILSKNFRIREARIFGEGTVKRKSPPAMPMAITETPSGDRRQILADPLS